MRRHAFELVGDTPAAAVTTAEINSVLDAVKASGVDRGSVDVARQHMAAVFKQLKREGAITVNPVDGATMPAFASKVKRERAVLTDAELAVYLAWQHPKPGRRMGVLERQIMSCISRCFGGVRTGDLHAMRWEAFDVEQGAFEWGYAPRQKKRRPQLLEVPAMLRPMLRQWWNLAGKPQTGLMFPVRRENCSNNRAGLERLNVSHAKAFRRDLARAFDAAALVDPGTAAPRRGSRRWREVFAETEVTRPVDFHSWRRSYCQALDDAGASPQQAAALAGHENLSVHAVYLRNAGKIRRMPENALPKLAEGEKALGKGTVQPDAEGIERAPAAYPRKPGHSARQGLSRERLDIYTEPLETSNLRLVRVNEKAPQKPFHGEGGGGSGGSGGLVEVLRAVDTAVLVGDMPLARQLLAVALDLAGRRARRTRSTGDRKRR
jgi:integrase